MNFLAALTIDNMVANLLEEDGVVWVDPIPPISAYENSPEDQNEANLDPYWEDDPGFRKVYPFLFPADQVWGNG